MGLGSLRAAVTVAASLWVPLAGCYEEARTRSVAERSGPMFEPSAARGDIPRPARPPKVVLIVVDALRADPIGAYGSTKGLTPTIDALADGGVVFDRALATSSWTVPSVASLVTGLRPEDHGLEEGGVRDRESTVAAVLDESIPTLGDLLHEAGYATIGVSANVHVCERLGFAQGFDRFETIPWGRSAQVVEWLEATLAGGPGEEPLFVLAHLFDPHHPYRPQEPHFNRLLPRDRSTGTAAREARALAWRFAGMSVAELEARDDLRAGGESLPVLRAAYESEVARADWGIARILEILGADDDTLVVVTADHGEEMREHGRLGHRHSLYSELVRVPLVVSWPARLAAGRSSTPVSVADIMPTVLELVGVRMPAGLAGRSLFPGGSLLEDQRQRPVHSTVLHDGRRLRSVALGPLRLIADERSGRLELFDEIQDSENGWDVGSARPDEMAPLQAALESARRAGASGPAPTFRPLDAETVEQLRRLGYLDSPSASGRAR